MTAQPVTSDSNVMAASETFHFSCWFSYRYLC